MSLRRAAIAGFQSPFRMLASPFVFARVYRQYRRTHPRGYAARIAFDIAFRGIPF